MNEILAVCNLSKIYQIGEVVIPALRGVSFNFYEGEFVVILGPSGSGKSTMLNLVGGIDNPTKGEIIYQNKNIGAVDDKELTIYRRDAIGFVFQFYNLIQNLTARENIEIVSNLSKKPLDVDVLLERIGMTDRARNFPYQLSGGQQQRIAIARALVKNPSLLLCDEPTGALDSTTGTQVLRLLKDFNSEYKKTVVVVTHNTSFSAIADRTFYIRDGLIEKIEENSNPVDPDQIVL
ncbi:MAG: ABC transporter ATP-binding protein [Defluviitaleaceae bacterium]|nr:ABC transporter ATP-binding protein [Defluviitaleaceae bacterium]